VIVITRNCDPRHWGLSPFFGAIRVVFERQRLGAEFPSRSISDVKLLFFSELRLFA
jgi:hypothetical protein